MTTIVKFETGGTLKPRTIAAIRSTLEAVGAEFIEENGKRGVRLRGQD